MAAASAAYTPSGPGSSSIAMTAAAIGVFAAAASIATRPTAARNADGMPKNGANAAPSRRQRKSASRCRRCHPFQA